MKKRERNLGFTLIELLVVIAIIGVLASIVLASLNNARQKSRDARRLTDVKQIQLALELFFDGEGNTYPAASATCDATTQHGLQVLTTEGYMPQVPRDPLSGATVLCYKYATVSTTGNQTTYHLGATLEDTANSALPGKNCNSGTGTGCPVAGAWTGNPFDGTAAGLYDVVP